MRRASGGWYTWIGRLAAATVIAGLLAGVTVPGPFLAGAGAAEKAGEKPGTREAKGRVQSVDAQAGTIVLTVRGKAMTFEVPSELRGELAKVRVGQRLEIDYEERDGKLVAATIEED